MRSDASVPGSTVEEESWCLFPYYTNTKRLSTWICCESSLHTSKYWILKTLPYHPLPLHCGKFASRGPLCWIGWLRLASDPLALLQDYKGTGRIDVATLEKPSGPRTSQDHDYT